MDKIRDIYVEMVIDTTAIISTLIANCVFVAWKKPDKVDIKITEVWMLLTIEVKSSYFKSSSLLHSFPSFKIKLLHFLLQENLFNQTG